MANVSARRLGLALYLWERMSDRTLFGTGLINAVMLLYRARTYT